MSYDFIIEADTMNPNQTAPRSSLIRVHGSILFAIYTLGDKVEI